MSSNLRAVNDNQLRWDDLRIVPGAFSFPGSADPGLYDWQPTGSGITFKVYKFNKNDYVTASCQMPHTYKEGSDLYFHIHWTPADRGTAEGTANVGWKVDYSIANIGDTFPAGSTSLHTDACQSTNDQHLLASGEVVDGSGLTISHVITLRIYREDDGANDTWSGTNSQAPGLLEFDIHYQIDDRGSINESTKN